MHCKWNFNIIFTFFSTIVPANSEHRDFFYTFMVYNIIYICVPILLYIKDLRKNELFQTRGAMYDGKAFLDGVPSQKKTFLKSLCKTIVNQAVKDSAVAKYCTSSVYDGVMPFAKCLVVTS